MKVAVTSRGAVCRWTAAAGVIVIGMATAASAIAAR
jgi:hypothetical protein